ncbi:ribonuclease H [Senna tora]|uniref:Ribonuclease H n=1 Tax=Senna tora TaxID=362788 RepID=A0A834X594_9FABA|nr:ribonuclease H [Senna tora]
MKSSKYRKRLRIYRWNSLEGDSADSVSGTNDDPCSTLNALDAQNQLDCSKAVEEDIQGEYEDDFSDDLMDIEDGPNVQSPIIPHLLQCGLCPLPIKKRISKEYNNHLDPNDSLNPIPMDLDADQLEPNVTYTIFQLSDHVHRLFADDYMDWYKAPTYVGCGQKIFEWASSTLPLSHTLGLVIQFDHNATLKWDLCHVNIRQTNFILYVNKLLIAVPGTQGPFLISPLNWFFTFSLWNHYLGASVLRIIHSPASVTYEDSMYGDEDTKRNKRGYELRMGGILKKQKCTSSSDHEDEKRLRKRVKFRDDVNFKESDIPYAKRFKLACKVSKAFQEITQGCTTTIQRLKQLVSQYNPNFIFLSETKHSFRYSSKLLSGLGYCNFVGTDSKGKSGGTILAWQDNQSCDVLDVSPNWIHITTHNVQGQQCQISFIYGFPALADRKVLWNWFMNISITISCAWMAVGDFNQIRDLKDKLSSTHRVDGAADFNKMIDSCGFVDLNTCGVWHTWTNKRKKNKSVWARLDRALCNHQWLTLFPSTALFSLPMVASDHCPLFLKTVGVRPYVRRPFHFHNMWLSFGECMRVVSQSWSSIISGSPAFILSSKLQIVGWNLKQWNRDEVGSIQNRIRTINEQLLTLQQTPHNNDLNSQWEAQHESLRQQMEFFLDCEESLWAQKARMSWLVSGDRNTSYFHNTVNKRRIQNSINAIKDDNGVWVDGFQQVQDLAVDYFKNIFTDNHSEGVEYSAPGPDGLNVQFFKHFWAVVKDDMFSMLHAFFDRGYLLKSLNRTYISLIPKTNAPQTFKDYRPISLANVAYKLISKVLCNIMKVFLGDLIAPNQSAFLKGRLISDNTVLVGELMHKMRSIRKGKAKWCALKLDIQKAYDKISWSFIEAVLTRMNFPALWIQYIMQCVTTVSYQLILNGGVRQGDPLSPYIFILCSNMLSCMITKEEKAKLWKGLKISIRAAPITHMMYADDTILFFEATDYGCQAVQRTLSRYAALSGQSMNLQKSFMIFSPNTSHSMKKTISSDMGLKFSSCLGKYLGTWIDGKCSKKKAVDEVIAKVRGKLQSWKSRCLSQAARLTLINSVINSYLVYPMSTIYFAKNDCKIIESIMARFFWGDQEDKRKVHLLTWKNLCRPKYDGGLGCRDVSSLNIALLAKHLWRMVAGNTSYASSILSLKYADASTPDALTISAIPVSATNQKDRLIWKHAPDGEYCVKAGYRFLNHNDNQNYSDQNRMIWKNIWKFILPNRIIMFMWKFLNKSLPTFSILRSHHLQITEPCHLCGNQEENINHVFLLCPFARAVWFDCHLSFRAEFAMNQKTMEGYQSCPRQALAAIYSQFALYKMAFDLNVNHPSQFNPVLQAKKFREVNIRDYISAEGMSIFCNYKKVRRRNVRNGATVDRAFFLLIRLNGVTLVEASYCLTSSQSLHQAFLIVLRRGIQLSQASATTSTCNFFVPNQRWATLLDSGYNNSKELQVVGRDIMILRKQYSNSSIFIINNCTSMFSVIFPNPPKHYTIGWNIM